MSLKVLFPGQTQPTTFTYSPPPDYTTDPFPSPPSTDLVASTPNINNLSQTATSGGIYYWGKVWCWEDSFPIFYCTPASSPNSKPTLVLKAACHINDGDQSYVEERVTYLNREAVFYNDSLPSLQGSLVPRHYGVWQSDATEFAGVMRCEILEYCGRNLLKSQEWSGTKEQLDLIAEAAEKLHDWGIYHGQLYPSVLPRHVLWREPDQKPVFIDFTISGDTVDCPRRIPLCPTKEWTWPLKSLCSELQEVGRFIHYQRRKDGYSEALLRKAMDWITEQRHCWEESGELDWDIKEKKFREQKELLKQWAEEELKASEEDSTTDPSG